jgi:hypothetical protein
LVDEALARIADPAGEVKSIYVKVYADAARTAAEAHNRLRAAGYVASPLAVVQYRARPGDTRLTIVVRGTCRAYLARREQRRIG